MQLRFKDKSTIFNIALTAIGGILSVATMLYSVYHFGLEEGKLELVLDVFYIACFVMILMFFFKTRLTKNQFNYWCSLCIGVLVLLRDILFPEKLAYPSIQLACLTLSVLLLCTITYFYARREWRSYTKANLWAIFLIDVAIAALYNLEIFLEPSNQFTEFLLGEIWIRPTITCGLVAAWLQES